MNEKRAKERAERLLAAEDATENAGASSSRSAASSFDELLAAERIHEQRIRSLALWCWGVFFASLVLGCMGFYVVVFSDRSDTLVDLTRSAMIAVMATGALSLVAASLASVTWLFRSRTPSLKAIERRLGALEHHLTKDERP